jgi:hypothetical protein
MAPARGYSVSQARSGDALRSSEAKALADGPGCPLCPESGHISAPQRTSGQGHLRTNAVQRTSSLNDPVLMRSATEAGF